MVYSQNISGHDNLSETEGIQIIHCINASPLKNEDKADRIANVINCMIGNNVPIHDERMATIFHSTLFISTVICVASVICNTPIRVLLLVFSIMVAQMGAYFVCTKLEIHREKKEKYETMSDELATIFSTHTDVFVKFYEVVMNRDDFEKRNVHAYIRVLIIKTLERMNSCALWLLRSDNHLVTVYHMINLMNLLRTRDINNERVWRALFKVIACNINDRRPVMYQKKRRNSWSSMPLQVDDQSPCTHPSLEVWRSLFNVMGRQIEDCHPVRYTKKRRNSW